MKIDEFTILTELKVAFKLGHNHWNTNIYKNPSSADTEALMKSFSQNKDDRTGTARFLTDPDGNVYLWDAYKIIHRDVSEYLYNDGQGSASEDGFTFSGLWDNEDGSPKYYTAWSDSYLDERNLFHLIKHEHMVKRMFGDNKVIYDQEMSPEW